MIEDLKSFWSIPTADLLKQLGTTLDGLTGEEGQRRLSQYGYNVLKPKKKTDALTLFANQFRSPLVIILIFAAALSFFLQDPVSATIILAIVFVSGLLGFWQERGATNAVEKLLSIVQIKTTALRDGRPTEIPLEQTVPGDVIILSAGKLVPGDSAILECKDLFVDQAALTGETFPAEKMAGVLTPQALVSERSNSLFMGTHVVSGTAKAVIVETGKYTEFGKIADRLTLRPPETGFEYGVRRFGYLLMEITLIMVITIFAVNAYFGRPILASFLFSVALAVGLTPQLLPAIVTVNLAHGAKEMATHKVIVKRLVSIENFGSMNLLCSDKTGTLTEGQVQLHSTIDIEGNPSEKVLLYACLNAYFETGFANPVDEAIRSKNTFDFSSYRKLDEVPYDFVRKRLSILVSKDNAHIMIMKGAVPNVLAVCSNAETPNGTVQIADVKDKIQQHFEKLGNEGFRLLGIAYRIVDSAIISKEEEVQMTFLGFLLLYDPPKSDIKGVLEDLQSLGISLKIITGDNRFVATAVSQIVGISGTRVLTGQDIHNMSDEALLQRVRNVDVFAEVDPNHKERIILAFKKAGYVVGFMGDGINDASALHAADVGISVESAADVAKEAADIVLLEKDLGVLDGGVKEGRKTFANTLKYVFMAVSANFGNMFSMAGASLFLSFLPLLPTQVLLTNLMTDFPELAIPTDSVDQEMVTEPRRWNIGFIRNFMLTFGLLSSVFDYVTFGVLLFVLHATVDQFRTGWFMESVISASLIVLVIQTQGPLFKSRPSKYLLFATMTVVIATIVIPFVAFARLFGFVPISSSFILFTAIIVGLYILSAELTKRAFYKRVKF
ncbi:MAG TPA: magnesium-translocating P-type ATPase [Candidatus Bathyarchaeia archaeon]|nr:magnesium-translocating P-type ATPase [Candidatus Bathyarchaeia archaeon]